MRATGLGLCLLIGFMAKTCISLVSAEVPEFHDYCAQGDSETVTEMIKKDPLLMDSYGSDGETCLMLASIPRSLELANFLIEQGANINARALGEGNHRMPVLAWHGLSGNHEIVDLLLKQDKIDVNAQFDGVDDDGNMVDIFTVLDLMDFIIDAPSRMDDAPEIVGELKDLFDDYMKVKELLVKAGAKNYLDQSEL